MSGGLIDTQAKSPFESATQRPGKGTDTPRRRYYGIRGAFGPMNPTPEPTPTQAGLHPGLLSSPLISPTSPLSTVPKMSASPRPRMPAGPRVRKITAGATTLTAQRTAAPLNFADYPPLPGSDRNSPGPSTSDSGHSASLPSRYPLPFPTNEKAVQTESSDPTPSTSPIPVPIPALSQPFSTPDSTRPSTPASTTSYRVVSKPTTLPIPTPVNFNVDPIAFKGLPLEAAQWSFTSDQLREMVSRAIRDSAKEQFITLLSLDALDKEIPEELARLESLKFTTQAQHRFHFQRRTNLLQSLNALANTTPVSSDNGGPSTLGMLIQQLAEVVASMDRFTETLLNASEHRSQLGQVQEKHLSSALAMALRKLNASYAKRTNDLKDARARIAALQTELEEAWKVAEGMAQEIDDLNNFKNDYAMEDKFEDGEVDLDNFQDEDPTMASVVNAQVVPVTGKAVISKATLVDTPPPNGDGQFLVLPNTHDRPPRPTNGSTCDCDRSFKVSAAKKRISLISQGAIKIQGSNPESDGGSEKNVSTTPKSNRRRARSQSKGGDPVSESPLLPSNPSNNSFLELSRPASPQPSDEEVIPPMPALVRVRQTDGSASASTSTGIEADVEQIIEDHRGVALLRAIGIKLTPFLLRLVSLDYSPGFSAAFDSTMIPPPPQENDLPSPLTRTSSVSLPHSPSTQDTRRIRSMQPSISIPSSLQDRDPDDSCRGHDGGLQDSPVVPTLKIPQTTEEAHIVPLPDAEGDDERSSSSHHAYDKSDLWPWTKRNTAILVDDAVPQPSSSSALTPVDDKIDPDTVTEIGPSSSNSLNIIVNGPEQEQALTSYLPDMTTPSPRSTNCHGTENADQPVSFIASEESVEENDGHERHSEQEGGARGEGEGHVPPSPTPSVVPEIPVFPAGRKPTLSLDRHGSIASLVARKSSLFKSHSGNSSHDKRSSMPLPSAVIASLLPWRGSRRPSSEPELPSQSSKSRLSSSLPSPH